MPRASTLALLLFRSCFSVLITKPKVSTGMLCEEILKGGYLANPRQDLGSHYAAFEMHDYFHVLRSVQQAVIYSSKYEGMKRTQLESMFQAQPQCLKVLRETKLIEDR